MVNQYLLSYLAAANLMLLLLMGIDKLNAKRKRYRIPEASLFLAAVLGGAIGGTIGMFLFRHKTRHAAFRICFPLLAALEILLTLIFGR